MITKIETLAANLDAKKLFLTTTATKKWSKPGVQKITLNLRIMCKDAKEENGKKGKLIFTNDYFDPEFKPFKTRSQENVLVIKYQTQGRCLLPCFDQ